MKERKLTLFAVRVGLKVSCSGELASVLRATVVWICRSRISGSSVEPIELVIVVILVYIQFLVVRWSL